MAIPVPVSQSYCGPYASTTKEKDCYLILILKYLIFILPSQTLVSLENPLLINKGRVKLFYCQLILFSYADFFNRNDFGERLC